MVPTVYLLPRSVAQVAESCIKQLIKGWLSLHLRLLMKFLLVVRILSNVRFIFIKLQACIFFPQIFLIYYSNPFPNQQSFPNLLWLQSSLTHLFSGKVIVKTLFQLLRYPQAFTNTILPITSPFISPNYLLFSQVLAQLIILFQCNTDWQLYEAPYQILNWAVHSRHFTDSLTQLFRHSQLFLRMKYFLIITYQDFYMPSASWRFLLLLCLHFILLNLHLKTSKQTPKALP